MVVMVMVVVMVGMPGRVHVAVPGGVPMLEAGRLSRARRR
jgi:hypothetical protein